MTFMWRGRQRWLWGTLATWLVRMHIAREIRPECAVKDITRDEALILMRDRMKLHFDRAWPVDGENE